MRINAHLRASKEDSGTIGNHREKFPNHNVMRIDCHLHHSIPFIILHFRKRATNGHARIAHNAIQMICPRPHIFNKAINFITICLVNLMRLVIVHFFFKIRANIGRKNIIALLE